MILLLRLMTRWEAHCQEQWLDRSVHSSSGLFPSGMPCAGAARHSRRKPFWARQLPGGKNDAKPEAVLWHGQTRPEATLGCPILAHLLLPARMWLSLKFAYQPLFRRHRELKLTLYLGWIFKSDFKVWDSWWLPTFLYHAKGKTLAGECYSIILTLFLHPYCSLLLMKPRKLRKDRISHVKDSTLDLSWGEGGLSEGWQGQLLCCFYWAEPQDVSLWLLLFYENYKNILDPSQSSELLCGTPFPPLLCLPEPPPCSPMGLSSGLGTPALRERNMCLENAQPEF